MRTDIRYWSGLGAGVLVISAILVWLSGHFGADTAFADLPFVPYLTVLLGGAAIVPALVMFGAPRTAPSSASSVLLLIFAVGLIARAAQFGATPILENDYQRYLWDGAQVAHGLSPYTYAPRDFLDAAVDDPAYWDLAETAWPVIEHINHPAYRTVYPPAAQAGFAISYWIAPLSLDGWRAVLLLFEAGIFAVTVMILSVVGRSPVWIALYWWHPLAIKEVANSAHMDPLLMLPVMAAIWAVLRGRPRTASALLALGAGVKIWPLLLMAPLLWSLRRNRPLALQCAVLFGAMLAILIWPVLAAGLDKTSGFVGFASGWAASSAAILVSGALADGLAGLFGQSPPQMLSRVFLGAALVTAIALALRRVPPDPSGSIRPYFLAVAALFLLSPSVTPWYTLWLLPFLCIFPNPALLLACALIGLHYSYFPLQRADMADTYRGGVVWIIWLPVWLVLFLQTRAGRRPHA